MYYIHSPTIPAAGKRQLYRYIGIYLCEIYTSFGSHSYDIVVEGGKDNQLVYFINYLYENTIIY